MITLKTVSQIQIEIQKFSPHPEHVKLLAVSKKQPVDKIHELLSQGQHLFGENYVQEALEKMKLLSQHTIEWHLIGHIQSKKINSIIGKFAYIHSVDSLKLAQLINHKSAEMNSVQKIFIEVNLGAEESKTGFTIENIEKYWPEISALTSVKICGLMALPPLSNDEHVTRGYFKALHALQQKLKKETDTTWHPLDSLSMGTSQDYPLALQEGATIIRVGTILFGERN